MIQMSYNKVELLLPPGFKSWPVCLKDISSFTLLFRISCTHKWQFISGIPLICLNVILYISGTLYINEIVPPHFCVFLCECISLYFSIFMINSPHNSALRNIHYTRNADDDISLLVARWFSIIYLTKIQIYEILCHW